MNLNGEEVSDTTLLKRLAETLRQTEFGDSELFTIVVGGGGVGVVEFVGKAEAFEGFLAEDGVGSGDGGRDEERGGGGGVDEARSAEREGREEGFVERER